MVTVYAIASDQKRTNVGDACVEPGQNRPPQITPALVSSAFKRTPIPASEIVIAPTGGTTLVNIPTIFSTQTTRFTRTVTLLGRRVQLDITPSTYTWAYGDGTTETTDHPGTSYRASIPPTSSTYLTHDYLRAATVAPHVDTTWSARFRVNGGPWRPVVGTVTIAGAPAKLVVRTARPTLVAGR